MKEESAPARWFDALVGIPGENKVGVDSRRSRVGQMFCKNTRYSTSNLPVFDIGRENKLVLEYLLQKIVSYWPHARHIPFQVIGKRLQSIFSSMFSRMVGQ